MHRLCKGVKIGNAPFQFVEAHIWVLNEKWNAVWVEEESCMPPDSDIVLSGSHMAFRRCYSRGPFLAAMFLLVFWILLWEP